MEKELVTQGDLSISLFRDKVKWEYVAEVFRGGKYQRTVTAPTYQEIQNEIEEIFQKELEEDKVKDLFYPTPNFGTYRDAFQVIANKFYKHPSFDQATVVEILAAIYVENESLRVEFEDQHPEEPVGANPENGFSVIDGGNHDPY